MTASNAVYFTITSQPLPKLDRPRFRSNTKPNEVTYINTTTRNYRRLRYHDDLLTKWNVGDAPLLSRIDMAVDSALGNSVPVSLRDISRLIATTHSSKTRMATKSPGLTGCP